MMKVVIYGQQGASFIAYYAATLLSTVMMTKKSFRK
jgi:hypothetical protein